MKIVRCDICGDKIDIKHNLIPGVCIDDPFTSIDMCNRCYDKFKIEQRKIIDKMFEEYKNKGE